LTGIVDRAGGLSLLASTESFYGLSIEDCTGMIAAMLPSLHPPEALLTAVKMARAPIAFLVGSPLSFEGSVGVPGVSGVVDLVRTAVAEIIPEALGSFEKALQNHQGGQAYQRAMEWLQGHMTQDTVNSVIQSAVLKARRFGSASVFDKDGDPSDWQIPAGTQQLAALIAHNYERCPGPVLTTNFDPLISLAVRKTGLRSRRRVLDVDGTLTRDADRDADEVDIVHLHGYWRESDTLHTVSQLSSPRPKLKAALQRLLHQRTLLVVAYGGWDDIFSSALYDHLVDDNAQCTILWCFRETDPSTLNVRYAALFERLAPAIVRGRFAAYVGIDCHRIFGDILGSHDVRGKTQSASTLTSPLARWNVIDPSALLSGTPLSDDEALRYFDGAWPTWRHAMSDKIPRRHATTVLLKRLQSQAKNSASCSFQLITGAGGEGKTTVLVQVAACAATSGDWIVLWRSTPRARLDIEKIASLDPQKQWLIVADEAWNLVSDVDEATTLLHEQGRSNVAFLFAARDTDWRSEGGFELTLETRLRVLNPVTLRGLTIGDADDFVTAWENIGVSALRALRRLPSHEQRVAALMDATAREGRESERGSLFGGLLATRFDADSLRAHAVELLRRLREIKLEKGNTLYDALLYIATIHAQGIPGLREQVLATLMGVPDEWLYTDLVSRLGEETAISDGGGLLLTRHRHVANAIVVEAEARFGTEFGEVWSKLIQTTAEVQMRLGPAHGTHKAYVRTIHAGPRIPQIFPKAISRKNRYKISLSAAEAAVLAIPDRLDCIVDLAAVYRKKDKSKAQELLRKSYERMKDKVDYWEAVRGFWYEWGMCEGSAAGSPIGLDACLQGISLSDKFKCANFTPQRVAISCAGLGEALSKLTDRCPAANDARAATAFVGLYMEPDGQTREHLSAHARKAEAAGAQVPKTLREAVRSLERALKEALAHIRDPFFVKILKEDDYRFEALVEFVQSVSQSELTKSRKEREDG
jgi:hypothetical protein